MEAILIIALYFLPAFIAHNRRHRNFGPVLVINLFLGWTVIGWVVALAMAASDNVRPPNAQPSEWPPAA